MKRCSRAHGRPQPPALPTGVRVVDPAIQPFREKPKRIRHAKDDPFAILQDQQSFRQVSRIYWHVRTQTERVELIDPRLVARLHASLIRYALELREGLSVERPPFGTVLPRRRRTVELSGALAPVEAGEMPTRERRPDDAVAVDVHSARGETLNTSLRVVPRQLVQLRERGRGWPAARSQSNDRAGETQRRSPHRSVRRRRHGVKPRRDPLVLRGIEWRVGLDVVVASAVAVCVENQRGPPL